MPKLFERVITVMLENTMRSAALANPYFNSLRKKGVFLTNSQGVTHPSQPNYFCMVSGDTMRITDDDNHYVNGFYGYPAKPGYSLPNITDLLEVHNMSWKCYAEDMTDDYKGKLPAHLEASIEAVNFNHENKKDKTVTPKPMPPWPVEEFPFARRHVPFLSFPTIVGNPKRLAKVVNANQFEEDLKNGELPHYSFYVPNLLNDGHSKGHDDATGKDIFVNKSLYKDMGEDTEQIDNVAAFLKDFLGDDPISKFPPETLIVLTFDEAYPYQYDYGVFTLLIADFLEGGTINTEAVNHYNLLATIEDNFGVGNMKRNDAIARPYWFMR